MRCIASLFDTVLPEPGATPVTIRDLVAAGRVSPRPDGRGRWTLLLTGTTTGWYCRKALALQLMAAARPPTDAERVGLSSRRIYNPCLNFMEDAIRDGRVTIVASGIRRRSDAIAQALATGGQVAMDRDPRRWAVFTIVPAPAVEGAGPPLPPT